MLHNVQCRHRVELMTYRLIVSHNIYHLINIINAGNNAIVIVPRVRAHLKPIYSVNPNSIEMIKS